MQSSDELHPDLRPYRQQPWPAHLVALCLYALLSLALTWPLATVWSTATVGGQQGGWLVYSGAEDAGLNIWNMWWLRWALEHAQNPFWTPLLYYPDGVQLYVQTFTFSNALLGLPITYLAGPTAAYNSAVLLAMTLTAYAGYLLARAFGARPSVAFLCGFLLTASPTHLLKLQVNQLNLLSVQWITLYFLSLALLERSPDRRHILLTVAAAIAVALTDWYWLLLCAVGTAPWVILSLLRADQRRLRLRAYLAVAGLLLVCLAPLLLGLWRVRASLPSRDVASDDVWAGYIRGFSADALALLHPNVLHPLWGGWMQQHLMPAGNGYAPDGWYMAAGWVLLGAAALGIYASWRRHWRWFVVAFVAWLISLGPYLQVAGQSTDIPLPYQLLQSLPLLSTARRPALFATICLVILTMFAAVGLEALASRLAPRRRLLALSVVGLLAIVELAPPAQAMRQVLPVQPPAFLQELRSRPGAVADLPFRWLEDERHLLNQIAHGQPILGGYVARWPQYPSVVSNPWLGQLVTLRPQADIVPFDGEALRAMQCAAPLRHVLLYKPELSEPERGHVLRLLAPLSDATMAASYEDAEYAWYELPGAQGPCAPFVALGEGWQPLEGDATRRWRWMAGAADVWLTNTGATCQHSRLDLALEAYKEERLVELWEEERLIGRWRVLPSVQRQYALQLCVPSGVTRLQLRSQPGTDTATGRQLSISALSVTLAPLD